MSALPAKELTTKQIRGVRFGFYTDDEVKRFSVKRIVSPLIFDNLKNPVLEGLYDPALGPIDPRGCCTTCNLGVNACPGHFGHIELPLPVYNPLIFGTLYRLLRNTCFFCFQFRLSREEMNKFVKKLACLMEDDLVGAVSVNLSKGSNSKELAEFFSDMPEERNPGKGSLPRKLASSGHCRPRVLTSTTMEAMREVIKEFFARVPQTKCANCGAHSPKIKKQGYTKLFKIWASTRPLVQNQMRGLTIKSVLDQEENTKDLQDLELAMEKELYEKKKNKDLKRSKQAEAEDKEALQSFKEDSDEDEDEDEEDEDENDAIVAPSGAKKDRASAEAGISSMDLQPKFMTPLEVEEIMRRLWKHEGALLSLVYAAELGSLDLKQSAALGGSLSGRGTVGLSKAASGTEGYHMFFVRVLPVAPNKFRPPSKVGEEMFEHAQNVTLARVLTSCLELTSQQSGGAAGQAGSDAPKQALDIGRYIGVWLQLQNSVCALMDSTAADTTEGQGIRQVLEKKEGLFRKNMMGKRVNFAARSVISPDPYIGAGEIGVPPYFAKRLSFPERVTPWNVERLREAVIRGPDELPGAVAVEDERGRLVLLGHLTPQRREAIAKQLFSGSAVAALTPATRTKVKGRTIGAPPAVAAASGPAGPGKIVYRHLRDGDLMLTNRQPTLHKPGLMAHRARVLKGERTIRMHYANCATFNADFDGDEINLHLPQDQLARAEGYNIVHADQQYIVPTDGKPIRGLIQDHVCGATLLTSRDAFFRRAEYMQLVYVACTPWITNPGPGAHPAKDPIELELPTVMKPYPLWTGKQVLSTVVRFFTRGLPPLTFSGKAKVPADYWGGKNSGEGELIFQRGYFMAGILDKNQFAKYGLVHAVQELYSSTVAGQLLNSFSRLFTHFLQWHGFTCGYDDLLLLPGAEARRKALLDGAEANAIQGSAEFVGQSVPKHVLEAPQRQQRALNAAEAQVRAALAERYRSNADTGKAHDMKGSGVMHKLSSSVVATCLPSGQAKAFPRNCLSLMTVTGAKGSMVNFSQISCLLGQQELEGRRPPRMSSGKTLPCFQAFDAGARSCGFIGDRFLTGLRPQEYYFHCMAGREGLVDTAVKTSRSGYLQRCLVKNLETLRVHYDGTVRDNCDGSVVQLLYGEDGLDVMNVSYMREFGFLARNAQRFAQQLDMEGANKVSKAAGLRDTEKQVRATLAERNVLLQRVAESKCPKAKAQLQQQLPLMATLPVSVLGAAAESFNDALQNYIRANADGVLYSAKQADKGGKAKGLKSLAGAEARRARPEVEADTFLRLMQLKFMRSQAAAGEAVGVLAAQSVGEPSTQMTLNTFHMAGRGEANVTLGIPRLREILMTAAPKIKTPVMTMHLIAGLETSDAHTLANRMRKLRLAECLSGISIEESPVARVEGMDGGFGRVYEIQLKFYPPSRYPKEAHLTFEELVECFRSVFCGRLRQEIERENKRRSGGLAVGRVNLSTLGTEDEAAAAGGSGLNDEDEAGATGHARKKKSEKDDNYEDAEEDEELREGKLRFTGGRSEAATYDAPDEEEADIAKQAERAARRGEDDDDDEDEDEAKPADEAADDDEEVPAKKPKAAAAAAKKAAKSANKKPKSAVSLSSDAASGGIDYTNFVCSVTVTLPLQSPKLLMLEIVEAVAASTMVRLTPNIEKVYVIEGKDGEVPKVQTDGINFIGAWQSGDLVDVNQIITNDVTSMLRTYGVEAARATIMREVSSVFNAYGIGVDPRHLCLIADFMTHQGGYRAMNRMGIESSVSPFLKMSFETATHFLTDATLKGSLDDLKSPSARICVGRVVEVGTGAVELVHQL